MISAQFVNSGRIVDRITMLQISFWESYAVFNLLTEIALLVLPVYTMWNVHIRMTQKLTVIACFAARIA